MLRSKSRMGYRRVSAVLSVEIHDERRSRTTDRQDEVKLISSKENKFHLV